MLNGGKGAFHRACQVGDVSEAIMRIAKHPDSAGHTFELVNSKRHMVSEFIEFLFEVNQDKAFLFNGIETTFDSKTMLRTGTPKNPLQKAKLKMLERDFALM